MTELHSIAAFLQTWWVELVCGVTIAVALPPVAGYFALAECKLITDMQADPGVPVDSSESLPRRIAETIKRLLKDESIPENANKMLFRLAPVISFAASLIALGAIAFGPVFQIARDINIGLLFVFGVSSLGLFGIFFGGWALHRRDSILAGTQATTRLITYQIAAALALVSTVLLAGSLKIQAIVNAQQHDAVWFVFLSPVAFMIYLVASLAGINRGSFILSKVESEYEGNTNATLGGFRWMFYLLAEYTNRIVVASVATTLFLGGWLRPFSNIHWLNWLDAVPPLLLALAAGNTMRRGGRQAIRAQKEFLWGVALVSFVLAIILAAPLVFAPLRFMQPGLHGAFWFLSKVAIYIYFFTVLRFAIPRFRFDQSIYFGWHFLIPIAVVNLLSVAIAMILDSEYHWNRWLAVFLSTIVTLAAAFSLFRWRQNHAEASAQGPTPAIATDFHVG